jgi:sulfotransferase family protein
VHLYRDGPVCTVSMSRHPVFRLRGFRAEVTRLLDDPPRSQADIPEQFHGLLVPPIDAERFMSHPIPLTFFGELWSELICRGAPALAELPPGTWTTLRYEDLILSPAAELSRLADFMGVPATSQWLAAATPIIGNHRPASAVADLEPAVLDALREACGPGTQAITAAEARLAAATA